MHSLSLLLSAVRYESSPRRMCNVVSKSPYQMVINCSTAKPHSTGILRGVAAAFAV